MMTWFKRKIRPEKIAPIINKEETQPSNEKNNKRITVSIYP